MECMKDLDIWEVFYNNRDIPTYAISVWNKDVKQKNMLLFLENMVSRFYNQINCGQLYLDLVMEFDLLRA